MTIFIIIVISIIIIGIFIIKSGVFKEDDANKTISRENLPTPHMKLRAYALWSDRNTNIRYVEFLKSQHKRIADDYMEKVNLTVPYWRTLKNTKNFKEYEELYPEFTRKFKENEQLRSSLDGLEEKINKILEGDVQSELYDLEQLIEQLKIDKQGNDSQIEEINEYINNETDAEKKHDAKMSIQSWKQFTREIDKKISEVNIFIKELNAIKSKNLYQNLKVNPETATSSVNDLKEVRDKSHIIDEIIPNIEISNDEQENKNREEKQNKIQKVKNAIQYNADQLEELKKQNIPEELKQRDIQFRENDIVELQNELHELERELRII